MTTLALPQSSGAAIAAAVAAMGAATVLVSIHGGGNPWLVVAAIALSGFFADLFTGLAHFGFDYVFPDTMPILGPIASEFREHHDCPTLDPSNYVVNLSKGAYASLPTSLLVCGLASAMPSGAAAFLVLATLLGMSCWALFFHQIHSYAHMGSCISAVDFKKRVVEISRLSDRAEQTRQFDKLFEAAPIPPSIRFLQRCRLILNPKKHNFHHIAFESDFSSVNGWSDPLMNLCLRPIARRVLRARRAAR